MGGEVMISLWIAAALLLGFVFEVLWVGCIAAVQNRAPIAAANIGLLLYLCTVFSTVLVVEQSFYGCSAFALGGWLGVYVGVKLR